MSKRKVSAADSTIGKNLAFFRNMAGLTQQQVAEQLNLNRTTYTKYETGVSEPSFDTLKKIASIFDIDVATLIQDDDAAAVSDITQDEYEISPEERLMLRRYKHLSMEKRGEVVSFINDLSEN